MYRWIGTVSNGIPRDRSSLTQFLGKTWRSLRSVAQHFHQPQDPLSKAMGSKKVWIGPGCGRSLGPQWNICQKSFESQTSKSSKLIIFLDV